MNPIHYLIYNKATFSCELKIGDINGPVVKKFEQVDRPRLDRDGSDIYYIKCMKDCSSDEDYYKVYESKGTPTVIVHE